MIIPFCLLLLFVSLVDAWKITRSPPPNLRAALQTSKRYTLPIKNVKGKFYEATIVYSMNEELEDTDLEIFLPMDAPIADSELNSFLLEKSKGFL